jgi:nucleoside-diphosphate-sugar epimerase
VKVLVTGASACLARAVLPRLCAEPSIERVTGIDLRPPFFAHPRFRPLQADFRSEEVAALLPEHDALLHMASVVLRGRMDAAAMREINVGASLRLLRAAQAAGLRRIVHLSSAAVYGGGANLAETAAYAPLSGFCYGQHKAELEQAIERALPQCVRLRPHVILGPHAQPVLRQILALPAYLRIADPQPELQCVHEDDVAAAVVASLLREVSGPFNLAAPGSWSLRDVIRARHGGGLPLSPAAARAALAVAHGVFGWGGEPGWLEGLQRTLTLDCRRAETLLGWRPARNAAQTLADTFKNPPAAA